MLTDKQQEFYNFVWDKKNWRPPTWKSIKKYMNFKSNQSVKEYKQIINKKGYKLP
jgi:SOS-response transcriptional repressor LexA